MNHTARTKMLTGALMAGGVALAGLGFGAASAYASPISGSMGDGSVRPVSPASRVGFDPQPEPPALAGDGSVRPQSPGVRVGFNPQPEPPV